MSSPARALTVSAPGSPSTAKQPQVYQIDFTAVASGKRIASTKRRVRWRFGFANPEALANGETGTACRGEEHDVTIVWSITSGKRLVLADGQEVHYSNNRTNIFDFSWTMKGNHVLKIVAHASPPIQANPGFRQYDFFVDGQSFFTFPKVYRLGLAPNDPRAVAASPHSPPSLADRGRNYNNGYANGTASTRSSGSTNIAAIEAPHNPDEEEAYLQEAIKNSLAETGKQPSSSASVQSAPAATSNLLLDFMEAPGSALALPAPPPASSAATVMTTYSTPVTGNNPFAGVPAPPQPSYASLPPSTSASQADPWGAPSSSYGAQPSNPYTASASVDPFAAPNAIAYAAPAPALTSDPFGAPPPAAYGAPASTLSSDPFGGSAQAAYGAPAFAQPSDPYSPTSQAAYGAAVPGSDPYGVPIANSSLAAPPVNPYGAPNQQQMYGQQSTQPQFGSPTPTSVPNAPDYTPASSLGFASPIATQHIETDPEPAQVPSAPTDPALLSMNVLSGELPSLIGEENKINGKDHSGQSMADQAYAKLVNMDAFSLVTDKKEQTRSNPFDMANSSSIGGNTTSLADMKKNSAQSAPKKEIMKTSTSLVLSSNQQGNFGGYGAQYGLGLQQPSTFGAQAPAQQPYVQQPQYGQQQLYGQNPPMQQFVQQPQYGQAPVQQYGQQQQFGQPPMHQQYGQPPMQQYGQPPVQNFGQFGGL